MNFITTFEVQVSSHTIHLHCFFLLAGIIELLSISLLRFYNSREFSGMSERKVIQNEHIQGQDCADNRRYWRGSDSLKEMLATNQKFMYLQGRQHVEAEQLRQNRQTELQSLFCFPQHTEVQESKNRSGMKCAFTPTEQQSRKLNIAFSSACN